MTPDPARPKPPVASVVALAAALLLPGLVVFIDSTAGRAFYRSVFEPLYIAGMVLALGFYALSGLAIAGAGWLAAAAAWRRRESPAWFRVTAIAATVGAPFVAMALFGRL